jgi:hypothetical protein
MERLSGYTYPECEKLHAFSLPDDVRDAGGKVPKAGASGDAWSHCREGQDEGTGIRKSRCLYDPLSPTLWEAGIIGWMADPCGFQP